MSCGKISYESCGHLWEGFNLVSTRKIWSEMESVVVVDVFCTISESATTFTSHFSTISISIIVHFLVFGFSHFDAQNVDEKFSRMSC